MRCLCDSLLKQAPPVLSARTAARLCACRDYNVCRYRGDERVGDFIGSLVLALLLVVLLRVLYAVCALLVRTRDGGNIAFAIALPAGLL